MDYFVEIINGVKELTILAKTPSQVFDSDPNASVTFFPDCKYIDYYYHSLSIFTKL